MRELKASELRVGNWVKSFIDFNEYENHVVTPQTIEEINKFEKHGYQPVPLTEDILLKCGFERIGGSAHIKSPVFGNYEWIELDWDGDHFNVFYRQGNTEGEIDTILQYIELVHIHELQNWWKVNTGEELNVQL